MNVPSSGLYKGLSSEEAAMRLRQYGLNTAAPVRKRFWEKIKPLVSDPLLVLLLLAAALYFLLGQAAEGFFMLAAIAVVSSVAFYQERRSARALHALQDLVEPQVTVFRDGIETALAAALLVPGDLIRSKEGDKIPADARIVSANDLSVNESMLTGESFAVSKSDENAELFQGTLINSGTCLARVTKTGRHTRLGELGLMIETTPQPRSALLAATAPLVRGLSLLGLLAFSLVFAINFMRSSDLAASLLYGLTLAMAAIPEEIPVAFTAFMALGAARLSRKGILARNPQTIENLGAVSIICLDKTGTLTENRMELRFVYDERSHTLCDLHTSALPPSGPLHIGSLASEAEPFDEMEKAIWNAYRRVAGAAAVVRKLDFEYPLAGTPPMMTHLYADEKGFLVAAKGAPEKVFSVCRLTDEERTVLMKQVHQLAAQGYRVIAVASARHTGTPLPNQEDYVFVHEGLLALYDPPRNEAASFISELVQAGVRPMLLTGDYAETAVHIAAAVGIPGSDKVCTGAEVTAASDDALDKLTSERNIFARLGPEVKRRVVASLKRSGAFVAMTGDGVNDAPAIRLAHVGIAMGHRGAEFSRQASDLVVTDDNLSGILQTLKEGRKILQNLKKVTSYILAIHIPIFLITVLPLLFGWRFPNLLSPMHVIFLELIMGPTCSIFYEGDAAAPRNMMEPPQDLKRGILSPRELWWSAIQGCAIGAGLLFLYFQMAPAYNAAHTRTVVFLCLLCANLVLTFANRSFSEPVWRTWSRPNKYRIPVLLGSLAIGLSLLLLPGLMSLLELDPLSWAEAGLVVLTAAVSVLWMEPFKAIAYRIRNQRGTDDNAHTN